MEKETKRISLLPPGNPNTQLLEILSSFHFRECIETLFIPSINKYLICYLMQCSLLRGCRENSATLALGNLKPNENGL